MNVMFSFKKFGILLIIFLCIGACFSPNILIRTVEADLTSDLIAYWRFDEGSGNIIYDHAGSNDLTNYGALWREGISGDALQFDGIDDYAEVPDNPVLQITGDLTIGVWVKPLGLQEDGVWVPIVSKNIPGHSGYGYSIWIDGDNTLYPSIGYGSSRHVYYNTPLPIDEWTHIVVVNDDEYENRIYINGVLASSSLDSSALRTDSHELNIGGDNDATRGTFNGLIDEVCIYNRVLNSDEILTLYEKTTMSLAAYWSFDEGSGLTVYDSIGDNHGTIYGGASWVDGVSGNALDFDGVDDYIIVPDNDALELISDFTVSCWVKPNDYTGYMNILTKHRRHVNDDGSWALRIDENLGGIFINYDGAGHPAYTGYVVPVNEWSLLTVTFDDVTNQYLFYVNDNLVYSEVINFDLSNTDKDLYISSVLGTYYHFYGVIDEVRIYHRVLTESEIQDIHNLQNDKVLLACWHFDEGSGNIAYDSIGDNDGTIIDMDTNTCWVDGISGTALEFDGIDDYVKAFNPFNSDTSFTVSTWIKAYNLTERRAIITTCNDEAISDIYDFEIKYNPIHFNDNVIEFFKRTPQGGEDCDIVISDPISINNWYHVVAVYNSSIGGDPYGQGAMKIYINGILNSDSPFVGHTYDGTLIWDNLTIGITNRGYPFEGIIDEINIYNYVLDSDEILSLYQQYLTPDIVYVDDDYTSSTPGWQYDHFDVIQDGIDVVDESGTVYVFNGIYYENVVIDKTINLFGENNENTIIDSGSTGDVIYITADWVNISNFNITNAGDDGIESTSDNNKITNNTFISNDHHAIWLIGSNNCNISNNYFTDNYDSIDLDDSNYNYISSNQIISNYYRGMTIYNSDFNTYFNNTIISNGLYSIHFGETANDNLIYNNYFDNSINAEDNGNNIWNITKTLGENIIGGPYLGGNYWNDYTGWDTDGDGLGDNYLPYNSAGNIQNGGDWLPLTDIAQPCIEITKTPDVTTSKVGDTVTYTICITNCGTVNLENVIVTDPMLGGTLTEFSTTLAIGVTECHSYTYTVQQGDLNPLCNTVTVHSDPEGTLTNDITDTETTCIDLVEPCIEVDKKVWNPDTMEWEDEIRVPVGKDLLFKITVINCGETDLTNIIVTDTLAFPQLEYRDNANPPEDFVTPDFHIVRWDIPILPIGEIFEITFHAESVHLCFGWNKVNVETEQNVIDEDLIPVKVIDYGQPIMDITKLVWDDFSDSWTDMVTRKIGTILTFKIIVNCTATSVVHNVIVTDDLPNHLNYVETITEGITIISESPHQVKWDLGDMSPGEIIEILYTVITSEEGLDDNIASVTTSEYYNDADSVLVKSFGNPPLVQLIYPRGGETLNGKVNIRWFALDSELKDELPIKLYYSYNGGKKWMQINDILYNNINLTLGEYEWDTSGLSDGSYKLLVEATDRHGSTGHDSSDSFNIGNDYTGIRVTDIRINDITIDSTKWVKDGDNLIITAAITGATHLIKEDITIDLSGFDMGTDEIADSFDGFFAEWKLTNIKCIPSNGVITVTVTADDISNSAIITADNTKPEVELLKPKNGLYLFNKRIVPLMKTIIFGEINIEIEVSDNSGIWKAEYYMNDDLIFTNNEEPFNWYMDIKLTGQHTILKVIIYDKAGNTNSASKEITVYNFFGK